MNDPIFEALGLKHVEPLGLGCRQQVRILRPPSLCSHDASSSDSRPTGLSPTATPWKPPTPLSASAVPWVQDVVKPWEKENLPPDFTNDKIGASFSGKWLDIGTYGNSQSQFRAEAPAFVPDADASSRQPCRPLSENAPAFVPGPLERGRSRFRLNEDAPSFVAPPRRRTTAPRSDSCLVDCSSLCFELLEEDLSPARSPRCSSRHDSPLVIPYPPSPRTTFQSHQ